MMIILKNINNEALWILMRALDNWEKNLKHNLDGVKLDKELRPKIQAEYEMTQLMHKDIKEMWDDAKRRK